MAYTSIHTGADIDQAVTSANAMLLTGADDPTTSTEGTLGQIYKNTTTGAKFVCTATGATYAWEAITDYTPAEQSKLANIEDGAQVNPEIVDDLITGGTDKALSAEQGKTLKGLVNANTQSISQLDAQKANQIDVRLKATKIELEDMSETTLGAMRGVEVLPFDPTGADLYEGRMWILKPPTVFKDTLAQDDTSTVNFSLTQGYKAALGYIPNSNAAIVRVEMKLSSRGSTLHDTGNDITVSLCGDNGAGLPDLSNVLAVTTITDCPDTPDTIFTGVANFDKAPLIAGVQYHFVVEVLSGSGMSYYSFRNYTGVADEISLSYYTASWVSTARDPACKIYGY